MYYICHDTKQDSSALLIIKGTVYIYWSPMQHLN